MVAVTTSMRVLDTYLGRGVEIHTLLGTYADALDRAGAAQLMVGRMHPGDARRVLDGVAGLVVTGGRDLNPVLYGQAKTASVGVYGPDDSRDIALLLEAHRRRMPVLAICRGLQAVNVALGGELHQHMLSDSDSEHPTPAPEPDQRNAHRHPVRLLSGSRLASIYGTTERQVNSLHHQAISRVAPGLGVVGQTPCGAIEAVESTDPAWPLLAVQWHPEMLEPEEEAGLFEAFVGDATTYAMNPAGGHAGGHEARPVTESGADGI
ncbi:MAG: gamma-glutamyl-gamma-aminobutyrate hydrolase family protein [bacterium]|nr:gamma-glutamyl-gamma-aminobutyrate hydrolase family protein [bacterium]MDE0288299.1 gamma-glutamyl-gamma-aminobutyrate hydrolase family protein [bacterium]MDE0437299.1 gamma-glutamyl-gamma-aminobutyrate hydrolase family protein [bacterium]